MARHIRQGSGVDQRGFRYRISYHPDWLDRIRVTRRLQSGRQSTKTLFRNPTRNPPAAEGDLIRARIDCPEQDLSIEVAFRAPPGRVGEVVVHWRGEQGGDLLEERVGFTLSGFPRR